MTHFFAAVLGCAVMIACGAMLVVGLSYWMDEDE